MGPYDQKAAKGVAGLFTLRRVMCIALTAELVALGVKTSVAGAFALSFTNIPWGWPQPPFVIFYPETGTIKFLPTQNPTFNDALKRTEKGRPGTVASFAVVSLAVVMQRVRERLAISVSKNG
jgi:hypothetical protein